MAVRKIVSIDEELCDGCGDCVPSCAEGAIQVLGGKAVLLADNLCDGLGACLGECPRGAIRIEERNADAFDEEAVHDHLTHMPDLHPVDVSAMLGGPAAPRPTAGGGCPGSREMHFPAAAMPVTTSAPVGSQLRQWPIQLHLVQPTAPYFQGADLLLAADCCAFASAEFHQRFLRGKALAMACPKLDQGRDIYRTKLTAMIDQAQLNTVTVLVMEVPCCAGLVSLAQEAAAAAARKVPIKLVVMGVQGQVLREEWC